MSSIEIKYKKEHEQILDKEKLTQELVKITCELFKKNENEIIVDIFPFGSYNGEKDILVKAETSRKRIESLEEWANKISDVFKKHLGQKNLKIGIKTYVLDFCWKEIN